MRAKLHKCVWHGPTEWNSFLTILVIVSLFTPLQARAFSSGNFRRYFDLLHLVPVLQENWPWSVHVFHGVLRAPADLGARLSRLGVPSTSLQPLWILPSGTTALFWSDLLWNYYSWRFICFRQFYFFIDTRTYHIKSKKNTVCCRFWHVFVLLMF